jgi:hypothetical protein
VLSGLLYRILRYVNGVRWSFECIDSVVCHIIRSLRMILILFSFGPFRSESLSMQRVTLFCPSTFYSGELDFDSSFVLLWTNPESRFLRSPQELLYRRTMSVGFNDV